MGDEDDGPVGATVALDDLQHALREVRRQGGSHLVEEQQVRLDGQGPGQVDDAERGERQMARLVIQVERLDAELVEPRAERLDRRVGEAKVGTDIQIRDEGRLLVHGDDPLAARLGWGMCLSFAAADGDPSTIGTNGPGQDLHEGALAGAVRAHQGMHFAGAHGQ